jgi:hypothetical protein
MEAGQLVEIRIRQKQLSAAVTLAASRRAVAAVSLLRAGSGEAKYEAEIAGYNPIRVAYLE